MKKKGGKLPSISIEGSSSAVFEVVNGRLVKVCGTCRAELDRVSGACPNGH